MARHAYGALMYAPPTGGVCRPTKLSRETKTWCGLSQRKTTALRGGGEHDSYWRLVRYDVKHKHADLRALAKQRGMRLGNMSNVQMADSLARHDRGLLTYENCSVGELAAFTRQRGVNVPLTDTTLAKKAVIRILHQADDDLSFTHLFDLPPEVCVMIYEFYCAHFSKEHLHMPTPQPLALVSQRLREEVIPVFHAECGFRIELTQPSAQCRLVPKTALFLSNLPTANLARIRWLHIYIRYDTRQWQDEDQVVQIKLSDKGSKYSLETLPYVHPDAGERLSAEAQLLVEQKLRPVLDVMLTRTQDRGQFVIMDIYRLLWAMRDAWAHHYFDEWRYEDEYYGGWDSASDTSSGAPSIADLPKAYFRHAYHDLPDSMHTIEAPGQFHLTRREEPRMSLAAVVALDELRQGTKAASYDVRYIGPLDACSVACSATMDLEQSRAVILSGRSLFETQDEADARNENDPFDWSRLRRGRKHDSYWRIPTLRRVPWNQVAAMTKKRGIKMPKGPDISQVVDRHHRFLRGCLTYDNCKLDQLTAFVKQRGILQGPMPRTREALISLLHAADDEQSFPYLNELAKETRLQIYGYYCSYFTQEGVYAPTQPPLARVCRQQRREVLPIFYSTAIFQIHLAAPDKRCRLTPETGFYFATLDPAYFARIRNYQICIADNDRSNFASATGIDVEFRLDPLNASYDLRVDLGILRFMDDSEVDWNGEPWDEGIPSSKQVVEQKMRAVLDGVTGRSENKGKLCLNDLHRLSWALQEIWDQGLNTSIHYEEADGPLWDPGAPPEIRIVRRRASCDDTSHDEE